MFSIVSVVDVAFEVLVWLVIGRCILSFIRHDPYHPLFKFVYDITEPVMGPFRKLVPAMGGIDFSPLIAILVLELIRKLVHGILVSFMG